MGISLSKKLSDYDEMIKCWECLVVEYPLSKEYKETLAKLQQERAEVASKIGKKKL